MQSDTGDPSVVLSMDLNPKLPGPGQHHRQSRPVRGHRPEERKAEAEAPVPVQGG